MRHLWSGLWTSLGLAAACWCSPAAAQTASPAAKLDRADLMQYLNDRGQIMPVRSVADWEKRRAEILAAMQKVMGPLPHPAQRTTPVFRVLQEIGYATFVVRRIEYDDGPGESVPAYLLVPKNVETGHGPAPAVLCLHGTDNVLGNKTVLGFGDAPPNRNYAAELAARGYVTLAPAYPLLANYQPDLKALGYASGTMKAIWDNIRGIDLLASFPFVKPGAFGVIGHSLGGHNSIFTAVFDPRIKVVISSSGFDSFADYKGGNILGWTQPRYMPRLAAYGGNTIPFDFYELIGALAPRWCFVSAPMRDDNFHWWSVDKIIKAASQVYRLYGVPDHLILEHPDSVHDFPVEMRTEAYQLLDRCLRDPGAPMPKIPSSP